MNTGDEQTNGVPAQAPSLATDAVLKPSAPISTDMHEVEGIDFNHHTDKSLTVDELISGMKYMGFQASAVGEAVRIINDMVTPSTIHENNWLTPHSSTPGGTLPQETKQPYS